MLPPRPLDAIRVKLLNLLDVPDAYALDRMDLTVLTTIDREVQQSVTSFLSGLADPEKVRLAGLHGKQLLAEGDPTQVTYAFTLYESTGRGNLLRVQTDNLNQPLSINDGTRLQLGSTAKLRTLITYLEVMQQLHGQLAGMTPEQLSAVELLPGDRLTAWAVDYLQSAKDRSLRPCSTPRSIALIPVTPPKRSSRPAGYIGSPILIAARTIRWSPFGRASNSLSTWYSFVLCGISRVTSSGVRRALPPPF